MRRRHQPLSTHCESTPGSVSMPACAPAERVSHILQLGPCHQRAPGPACKILMKQNAYLTQRNAFVWRLSAASVCGVCAHSGTPGGCIFILLISESFYPLISCVPASLTSRLRLQAVPSAVGLCPESHRPERQPSLSNSHKVSL